ncbi:hypothetical protein COCSADRAFT_31849 [Bipolaris sorokiniana ND90Pr]|uniref:Uncharacterized protein n=1 Tax=Cochliobolus sativus (strain ND90Pr / ATCC 201652) TaxID=665912 RepID=M2SPE3_COCSN|nr:uncharacterized protein COCSADRAFT_31849 [Bipolaris sorokiniana ND90Pr]EMD69078.1 hypothetical protein COCSADRAFT_31849 [Bipolaris sorokiniana ND90Pr]
MRAFLFASHPCLPFHARGVYYIMLLFTVVISAHARGTHVAPADVAIEYSASIIGAQRGSWIGACLYFVLPRRALWCMDS